MTARADEEDVDLEQRDDDDLAALRADRETLASVTDDLVAARIAIRVAVAGLSPRAVARLDQGARWVRLPANAARSLLEQVDR